MIQRAAAGKLGFSAAFTKAGAPFDPVGGVTVNVFRQSLIDGIASYFALFANATPVGQGLVYIVFPNIDFPGAVPEGDYLATFKSADATVDQRVKEQRKTVDPDWLSLLWAQLPKIGSTGPVLLPGTIPAGAAIAAVTSSNFNQIFSIGGLSIAGWAKVTFTLKRSIDDSDTDALLLIRKSNPADAGTDGVLTFKGKAVAAADPMRLAGLVAVLSEAPDSSIQVVATAGAMMLPASTNSQPWVYQLDFFNAAGDKFYYIAGELVLNQSALRSVIAP